MGAIDDLERNIPLQENTAENLGDLLKIYLSKGSLGQKSRLSAKNLEGILSGVSINVFLFKHFNIVNDILVTLIKERLEKSISLDGLGRQEISAFMSIVREAENAQIALEQEKNKS